MKLRFSHSIFILAIILYLPQQIQAQVSGGQTLFSFLKLDDNARVAALGGYNVSLQDADVNLGQYNPASINKKTSNHASINYMPFYADVKSTSLNFARQYKENRNFQITMRYIGYGTIEGYDETEVKTNDLKPRDFYFGIGTSRTDGAFTVGASAKYVHSDIAGYTASALLFDLGGMFKHPEKELNVGFNISNIGFLLDNYYNDHSADLPVNVQMGVSFKPQHMPVRFSFTAHHLQTRNITYFDPSRNTRLDDAGNEITEDEPNYLLRTLNHMVVGTEFLFFKGFNLRAGYNLQRRKELLIKDTQGLTGFSFGGMLKVRAFRFEYTRSVYHAVSGVNVLTLNTDLGKVIK